MTRVDFYLLSDVDPHARLRFACRLASKAVAQGNKVHLRTPDAAASLALDDLMWTYPEDRFLPHAQTGSKDEPQAPVSISHEEPPSAADQVLINLGSDMPNFFSRFERVAEVFIDAERSTGRERYRAYRDRGYPLFHHELDNWEE
ncbi:MAG: DNA polymerase III subunit chi [Gammaproteobacteria bacterium]|nr:DNA polymerase III subunit chi [Gammaproteobacteria bacterium]